jgi:hypothetical protein
MKFTMLRRSSARSNVIRVINIMQHLGNAIKSTKWKFAIQPQKYARFSVLIKHLITNLVNRAKLYVLQDK